jgi:hypothetical protein
VIAYVIASEDAEARRIARSDSSNWHTDKVYAQILADEYTADDKCDPRCVYKVYRVTLTVELEEG